MRYAILLSLSLLSLGLAAPAAAESGDHECTTTAGLGNPFLRASVDANEAAGVALGGCTLVTLSDESTVTSVDPADGCSISVDTDGDGVTDEQAAEDTSYPAESTIAAFCDLGTVEATNAITLA